MRTPIIYRPDGQMRDGEPMYCACDHGATMPSGGTALSACIERRVDRGDGLCVDSEE